VKVRDIDELPQRIMQVWDEFDHGIIDGSVKQWRGRLEHLFVLVLQQMADSLTIKYECNIIRTI